VPVFVQDPDRYLRSLGIEVADALDGTRPARIDAAHRSIVNYEVFYFADPAAKARFDADPLRWCGLVTDPVTHERFRPTAGAPRVAEAGRLFVFASPASATTFRAMPAMYRVPSYEMLPAGS
jgi:YHS domain-containing protein